MRECHEAAEAAFPDYELLAVKEKYGVLAFQAFPRPWRPESSWSDDEAIALEDLVETFVERSSRTCERCGRPGDLRTDRRHHRTLCDACARDGRRG